MVTMHHHVCQGFSKNLILAFVCRRKTVIPDVYRSINKCTETTQYNLHSLPYVLLFRDAVSIPDLSLLDCRSGNFDIVYAKSRYITQYIRSFPKHQKSGVCEQPFVGDIDLFAKFDIADVAKINKVACLSKCETVIVESIKIEHLNT